MLMHCVSIVEDVVILFQRIIGPAIFFLTLILSGKLFRIFCAGVFPFTEQTQRNKT